MSRGPVDPPARPPAGYDWHLPTVTVPTGVRLFRLNDVRHTSPVYFSRTPMHRFDAPDATYGVCYFATSLDGCFLEKVRVISAGQHSVRAVTMTELSAHRVAVATVDRPLRLALLADDGLPKLGIDVRVTSGDDYILSREWSLAIHNHPRCADGLLYPSRHHNGLYNVALFERAASALDVVHWGILGDEGTVSLWVETSRVLSRFEIVVL